MAKNYYIQKHCGVYKITNKINGMIYIGQSVDIIKRWQSHATKNKSFIGLAISESPESFTFEIIEECERQFLNEREKFWIKHFCCIYPNGYNKTSGGTYGSDFSKDIKKKISENVTKSRTGRKFGPRSEETRKKISDSMKNSRKISS